MAEDTMLLMKVRGSDSLIGWGTCMDAAKRVIHGRIPHE